jgi:hypothetical protein
MISSMRRSTSSAAMGDGTSSAPTDAKEVVSVATPGPDAGGLIASPGQSRPAGRISIGEDERGIGWLTSAGESGPGTGSCRLLTTPEHAPPVESSWLASGTETGTKVFEGGGETVVRVAVLGSMVDSGALPGIVMAPAGATSLIDAPEPAPGMADEAIVPDDVTGVVVEDSSASVPPLAARTGPNADDLVASSVRAATTIGVPISAGEPPETFPTSEPPVMSSRATNAAMVETEDAATGRGSVPLPGWLGDGGVIDGAVGEANTVGAPPDPVETSGAGVAEPSGVATVRSAAVPEALRIAVSCGAGMSGVAEMPGPVSPEPTGITAEGRAAVGGGMRADGAATATTVSGSDALAIAGADGSAGAPPTASMEADEGILTAIGAVGRGAGGARTTVDDSTDGTGAEVAVGMAWAAVPTAVPRAMGGAGGVGVVDEVSESIGGPTVETGSAGAAGKDGAVSPRRETAIEGGEGSRAGAKITGSVTIPVATEGDSAEPGITAVDAEDAPPMLSRLAAVSSDVTDATVTGEAAAPAPASRATWDDGTANDAGSLCGSSIGMGWRCVPMAAWRVGPLGGGTG